jgi:hypothetical protein
MAAAEDRAPSRASLPGAVVPGTRDWTRRTFGPGARVVLRSFGEAFFVDPQTPDAGSGERLDWLVADVDDFVSHATTQLRTLFRIALVVLEIAPLFVIGRWSRASRLPLAERAAYLGRLERSKVAQLAALVVLWKTLLTIVWFEHPESAPAIGHDGRHLRHLHVGGGGLVGERKR